MDGIHYILHVCTLHLMYVYMCVCVVWHMYFGLIPSSLFILPNTDQVSVRQEEENHIYQTHDQSFSLWKGL